MSSRVTRSVSSSEKKITDYMTSKMSDADKKAEGAKASKGEDQIEELRKLLEKVGQDVSLGNQKNEKNFEKLGEDISEIKKTLDKHESEIEDHEIRIKDLRHDVDDMAVSLNETSAMDNQDMRKLLDRAIERIKTLEKNEMENALYSRKYNLLIYGIEGKETDTRKTEDEVRRFAKNELKIGREFQIANTHRLPKRYQGGESPGPDPIVVKFMCMSDREDFLRSAINIPKESKKRVRTHLPHRLAKERAKLARQAYSMRQDGLHARIREKGAVIWIESRKDIKEGWSKISSIFLSDIMEKENAYA